MIGFNNSITITMANTGKYTIEGCGDLLGTGWKISSIEHTTNTYPWINTDSTYITAPMPITGQLKQIEYTPMPITTNVDPYDLYTGGPKFRAFFESDTLTTHSRIIIDFDNANWQSYLEPSERLKQIMRDRCSPTIITSKSINKTNDIREIRARETLRRVLGTKQFNNFICKGFVSVKAKSGLVYQIFPGHGITNVYNKGTKVERLCVVLSRDFPPTDSLIMRFLLVLNNEERFRNLAIKHSVYNYNNIRPPCVYEGKSLVEIYKEIKGIAA